MERFVLPPVDLALPVSAGPESSSVSDLACNGSVTGREVQCQLICVHNILGPRKFLSFTSKRLPCLMVTCIAWGHTIRILGIVDNVGGEWSGAVASQCQQR